MESNNDDDDDSIEAPTHNITTSEKEDEEKKNNQTIADNAEIRLLQNQLELQNQIETLHLLVKTQDEKVRALQAERNQQNEQVATLQRQLSEQQVSHTQQMAELLASQGFLKSTLSRILPTTTTTATLEEENSLLDHDEMIHQWDTLNGSNNSISESKLQLTRAGVNNRNGSLSSTDKASKFAASSSNFLSGSLSTMEYLAELEDEDIDDDDDDDDMDDMTGEGGIDPARRSLTVEILEGLQNKTKPPRRRNSTMRSIESIERDITNDDDRAIVVTERETHATERLEIPETTYSFLLFLKYEKRFMVRAAIVGISVFCVQMLAYGLMIFNSMDRNQTFNPFDFPPNVPVSTRIAEFLALIIIVASDDDAIKAVLMWYDGYNENIYEGVVSNYSSITTWRLSVYTRGIQGLANILAAFILVMQSLTVVDLLLNFTALQFLSCLDDTVFFLSRQGFVGRVCKRIADEITQSGYRIRAKNHFRENLPKVLILAFYLPLLVGYFYISARQFRGNYSCQTLFIQFDDAVQYSLPGLSGHYKYHNDGEKMVYNLDVEERIGKAWLQYCSTEEMWTLTIGGGPDNNQDHCEDWIVRSSSSRAFEFDITAAIDSEWIVRNSENKEIVMEDFRMFCADCSVVNFCGPMGACNDDLDRCICQDGWYGLRCDFLDPCSDLEIGTPNKHFPGFRQWSRGYTRLTSPKNNESTYVSVYEHPVYYGQTSPDIFDLIIFTGKRWAVTSSVMLSDFQGEVTKENLVAYLENDFHSYWSNFSSLLVSDTVEIDSSSDVVSPDGLIWFQYDDNMDILQSIDITLLCIVCDNSTNLCFNEGVCTIDNRCDCTVNGAAGALCQLPPVGNGFCDSVFNTPYFNFDGGDCCQGTCLSDDFTCGWNKQNTKYLSYCDCADPDHICPDDGSTCWLEIGAPILGETAYAESGRSVALSIDGTILAVGEPSIDQVRLFDNDGSKWNTLGAPLKGEPGSGFGGSVALSGDGRVVGIGSPNFNDAGVRLVDDNSENLMQGKITIFELMDFDDWYQVDEMSIATLGDLYNDRLTVVLDGRLGSTLALSQDGRLVVFGIDRVDHFRGAVFGYERNDTSNTYFQNSEAFLLEDTVLWETLYKYWARSISVSKSAHMISFDAIDTEDMPQVLLAKYETDDGGSFGEYRLFGTPIAGRGGILSGNGQALVVTAEEDVSSTTCQVYDLVDEKKTLVVAGNWTKRGNPLGGTALAFSSDGLTLAVARNDSTTHTYFWNQSHWLHQGHIAGAGSEVSIVLSGGQGGADMAMAVGLPSDSSAGPAQGKTSVYKLRQQHGSKDGYMNCQTRNSIIDVGLFTDNRPNETIWEIRDFFTQDILVKGGPYNQDTQRGQFISNTIEIPDNTSCAEFAIYDLGGDGICCEHGFGSYSLSFGNVVEKIGGNFEWSEKHLLGTSCRRTCEHGESLLAIEVTTDLYPGESTWILSEQTEGVVGRGGPFEMEFYDYVKEVCVASNGCFNFTMFDDYGDGMCCLDGIGGYALRLDGEVIAKGDMFEHSDSVSFGQCLGNTNVSGTLPLERYSSLSVTKLGNDTIPFETEWFLYEIGSENVISGNQSMNLTLDKHLCHLFEAFRYEGNEVSELVGYALHVDGELVVPSDTFLSGTFRMIGSCGHVATTISVAVGNYITCVDDASNFCAAPNSCASVGIDIDPTGENVFGIGLNDGVWTTSGAYSLAFESDCDIVCSGACNTAIPVSFGCGDDEVVLRLQIASHHGLDWYLGRHDGEIFHEGSLSQNSHTVVNERICIAAHVCTLLTFEGDDDADYLVYLNGAYFVSGNTYHDFSVETVCPEAAKTKNSMEFSNETSSYLPSNDWCNHAISLTPGGATVQGSTDNATADAVVRCGDTHGSVAKGVWYHVAGTGNELVADLCESEYDTQVSLFEGSCNSLTCVTGNDDYCGEDTDRSRVTWSSFVGADYFIFVHGYGLKSGNFVLEVTEVSSPINDNCSAAVALSLNSSIISVSGFFDLATIDNIPSCYEEREITNITKTGVWYSVLGTGRTLIVDACESDAYTRILVFSGSCDTLTCVAFQEKEYYGGECGRDRVDWQSEKGTIYFIFLSNTEEVGGAYSVDVGEATAENDVCSNAIKLKVNDTMYSSSTWASEETIEFSCGGDVNSVLHGPGVWFYVLGTGNPIKASTCNNATDWDTQIAVFTGDCDALSCIAGSDDFCGVQSTASWSTVVDNVYYILVQGWSTTDYGDIELEIYEEVQLE